MDFLFILSCRLTLTWRVQVTLGFSQTRQEMMDKHRVGPVPLLAVLKHCLQEFCTQCFSPYQGQALLPEFGDAGGG